MVKTYVQASPYPYTLASRDFQLRLPDTDVEPRFIPLALNRWHGGYAFTPYTGRVGLASSFEETHLQAH